MQLARVIGRKTLTVLGLNSGTSADSLDMAVVTVRRAGGRVGVSFVAGRERRLPPALREAVTRMASAGQVSPEEVIHLDNALGRFFGQSAAAYAAELASSGTTVHAVASHGQTVRHVPQATRLGGYAVRGTLQLGSPDGIAAATGLVAVGDFRQADVALGGEGAPITGAAMRRLFADPNRSRLIVNIGGMANYFYLPSRRSVRPYASADCGPGNSLSDLLVAALHGERCDRDGRRAASGQLSGRLLSLLLGHPFFRERRRSTGREDFGAQMARRMIGFARRLKMSHEDLMRTAAELTTLSIATAVWPVIERDRSLTSLYLTGGGRKNRFFVQRLRHHLPDIDIRMIDDLGVSGDLVEAAAFAVLGEACLRSEPLSEPAPGKGRKRVYPVLGRLVQPPQERRTRNR